MKARRERIVIASGEFAVGDEIEAWHRGTLYRRGTVMEVIPATGLIWIVDAGTGARTLLDPDASDIVRMNQSA